MDMNRRTACKSIGAGTVALLGGVGTAAASPPSEGDTIVDVAVAAGDFDVLVAAVQEAGLVDALSGNRQLTVFAPTDAAFGALADELGVDVEDLLELDNLEEILTYHVTPGRRDAETATDGDVDLAGELVDLVLDVREAERDAGNYERADELRDALREVGVEIEDGADGTTYRFE